jgi:fatty-acyl-CoA synthase
VETVLITYPGVLEVAVVAMPDEKWGEVPCAFITLTSQAQEQANQASLDSLDSLEADIIAWARGKMPHFMAPKKVIFAELPKTATGKVQKNLLRKRFDNLV